VALCLTSCPTWKLCSSAVEVDLARWTRTVFRLSSEWASFVSLKMGCTGVAIKLVRTAIFMGTNDD
jgi:hypothetical protein